MADLVDGQATTPVKIIGSDVNGLETTPVNASPSGDLFVRDVMNVSAVQSALTVSTTAVECKVGASVLINRKLLILHTESSGYFYGFSQSFQPFELKSGVALFLPLGSNISVWVKKSSFSGTVNIAELS